MLRLCLLTMIVLLFKGGSASNADTPVSELLYDVVETDNKGNEFLFNSFQNKVLFIINVASRCPYTKDYYSLFRRLFKYKKHGLEIILAPSNQVQQTFHYTVL